MADDRPLIETILSLSRTAPTLEAFLNETAAAIQRRYPEFNWVGFYFLKNDGKLHVGPYVGKPTPHAVIDLDRGICGAAVREGETIVVDDVNSDPRYLACSLETRSEIVIPIRLQNQIIGELDIDSERLAAFGAGEKAVLEKIAEAVGARMEGGRWN